MIDFRLRRSRCDRQPRVSKATGLAQVNAKVQPPGPPAQPWTRARRHGGPGRLQRLVRHHFTRLAFVSWTNKGIARSRFLLKILAKSLPMTDTANPFASITHVSFVSVGFSSSKRWS